VTLLLAGACSTRPVIEPRPAGPPESTVTFELRLDRGWQLSWVRLALDHEILYMNARPADHPPPRLLTRLPLSPGDHPLQLETRLASPDGKVIPLQRGATLRVARRPVRVHLLVGTSRVEMGVTGAELLPAPSAPELSCDQLNSARVVCDGEPVQRALCRMRQLVRRAEEQASSGWRACVQDTTTRLDRLVRLTAEQATREPRQAEAIGSLLGQRADALRAEAERCVRSYFICR